MFTRLIFSQMVVEKLVEAQDKDFHKTLASLSDDDINTTRRCCGLVSRRATGRGDQISILVAKNHKLDAFMFKTMEHCSKP